MRTFDGFNSQLLSGNGNTILSGAPVENIPNQVNFLQTLRASYDAGEAYSWLDRADALKIYDSVGNLFSFAPSSVEYVETVIAAHGLYAYDSTPLSSVLSIRDALVDENLNTSAGYSWTGNRAFGLELISAAELMGLRVRVRCNTQGFTPDQWAAGSSGTFVAYQSSDNNTWTQIKSFSVDDSDNLNRYITDAESGYYYLDFWFDQAVTAKYFKIFTSSSFQISDGSTNSSFTPCEVLGYVVPGDSFASLRNGSFFTGNNPLTDPYTTLSLSGGTTLYNGTECSGISSEWELEYSLGLRLSKITKVSSMSINAVNYTGGDNFNPDHFVAGESFSIYRSFDNIYWDALVTAAGSSSGIMSEEQNCGTFDIGFGGSYLGKYFIAIPDDDTPRWEDMGGSYTDTLNPAEIYLS